MKILLFGPECMGKGVIGELLARRLGIPFFDLDDQIGKKYGISMEEFEKTVPPGERDRKRGVMIRKLMRKNENLVLSVTPLTDPEYFKEKLYGPDVLSVELHDQPQNIYSRFGLPGDDGQEDGDYDIEEKIIILSQKTRILEELINYTKEKEMLPVIKIFDMEGDPPERVADRLLEKYFPGSEKTIEH
jgi:hypothetical protein